MLTDWLFWGLGGALALAGLWLLYWSLFHDRSRGRRRCPKCWYDMSGAEGRRCPECGREAKSDRRMLRTRRRWRLAALGPLLLFGGLFTGWGPRVYRDGWMSATPTAALIALYPRLDVVWRGELEQRMEGGTLRQWEYRLLVNRCVGILRSPADDLLLIEAAKILSRIEIGGRNRVESEPWKSWALATEINPDSVPVIARLLDHESSNVRLAAIKAIGQFTSEGRVALPALLPFLGSDDKSMFDAASSSLMFMRTSSDTAVSLPFDPRFVGFRMVSDRKEFFSAFAECGTDAECAIPHLMDGLKHRDEYIRSFCIWALAVISVDHPGAADPILDLAGDWSEVVRKSLASATAVLPFDDRVAEFLTSSIRWGEGVESAALWAIMKRGDETRSFLPLVESLLEPEAQNLGLIARCYVGLGGDPERAIDALLDGLDRPATTNRHVGLLDSLASLGIESQRAADAITPLLKNSELELGMAAANAMIMLGGDADVGSRTILDAFQPGNIQHRALQRVSQLCRSGRIPQATISDLLDSDNVKARLTALSCIAYFRVDGAPHIARLRELTLDPDPDVAQYAPDAVERTENMIEYRSRK
jgi:HEAT repeat protein